MKHTNQIKNLIEFTALFLSGDLDPRMESTDYYKEKFNKYIGVDIKLHAEKSTTYKKWAELWGEDEEINSMLWYFIEIVKIGKAKEPKSYVKHWLTLIEPSELLDSFTKWIGDIDKINTNRYSYINPLVKEKIYNEYINKNIRYFKLLRIINCEE